MSLEELNKKYIETKAEIDETNKRMEQYEKDKETFMDDFYIAKGESTRAAREGNEADKADAEKRMEEAKKSLEELKEKVQDDKVTLVTLSGKINEMMESLRNNPEMAKHIDTVLDKKYERKLKDLDSKKEAATEKKEVLQELNEAIAKHPTLENNLKGLINASQEKEKLAAEAKSLDPNDAANQPRLEEIMKELKGLEGKFDKNKELIMEGLEKFAPNVKWEDVNEIVNDGYSKTKDGKDMDIQATLHRKMKAVDREIRGYDKQIDHYSRAARDYKLPDNSERPARQNSSESPNRPENPDRPARQNITEEPNRQDEGKELDDSEEPKKEGLFKRIANWFKDKFGAKAEALPEAPSTGTPSESKPQNTEKNSFQDSLKYEIVRDVVAQMEKEEIKDAKNTEKEEMDRE